MRLITLDFETYYAKDYSLTSKRLTTEAYVRDPKFEVIGVAVKVDGYNTDWFSGTMPQIKKWLSAVDWSDAMLLCQNTAFDGFILSHHFGIKPRFYLDTMSMAKPMHGVTTGCSLENLAKYYNLGAKGTEVVDAIGKRREDFSSHDLEAYGRYCINDVNLTYALFKVLKPSVPVSELKLIDCLLKMYCDPVLVFDRQVLEEHLLDVRKKKETLLHDLKVSKDELMSNDKFAEVLSNLGVTPPTKINKRGNEAWSFSKQDVAFMSLLEHENTKVQAIMAARLGVKSTLEETRTETYMAIQERGPMPIMLNYYGAHTGRASGSDNANFQNLPRGGKLRQSIRAPEGYRLVASDSAQIEARVNAWLSGEDGLVRDFANGEDIYSKFASTVYGYEVQKKTHKIERHVGKTCILGLGYGMGASKFQRTLKVGNPSVDLDINRCQDIVQTYRATFPKIKRFWYKADDVITAIYNGEAIEFGKNNLLRTSSEGIHLPNGMLMRYTGLRSIDDQWYFAKNRKEYIALAKMLFEQKATGEDIDVSRLTYLYGPKVVENIVQALARIVVMDQMVEISKKYKPVLTVHDEVVCCVREAEAEDAKAYMMECMAKPPVWAPDLPIACEADIGVSYGDAK